MDIQVLEGIDGLAALREEWDGLMPHIFRDDFFLTFDWVHAQLFHSRFRPRRPMILVLRESGRTVGIVPLCFTKKGKIFPLRALEIIGTHHSSLRGSVVHREYAEPAARETAGWLLGEFARRWDYLHFEAISPEDSFLRNLFDHLSRGGAPIHREKMWDNILHRVEDGLTADAYYHSRGRKTRQALDRSIRQLNQAGEWEMVLFRRPGRDLETAFDQYYDIHADSWKQVRDPDFHRRLGASLAAKGMIRLFILYFRPHKAPQAEAPEPRINSAKEGSVRDGGAIPGDMEPIAAWLSVVRGDKVNLMRTAYRQGYAQLSPGRVLLWFVLKHHLDSGGVRAIDYQTGAEGYKLNLGEFNEHRFRLLAANPRSPAARLELWAVKRVKPAVAGLKQAWSRFRQELKIRADDRQNVKKG